jgi:S1-C subfamily serine protease
MDRSFSQQAWPVPGRSLRRLAAGLLACALVVAALLSSAGGAFAQEDEEAGVLVVRVLADSAAADAGLRRGDIILSVDGAAVNDVRALMAALAAKEAGDEIEITYLHGDDEMTATLTLGEADGRALLGIVPFPGGETFDFRFGGMPMPEDGEPPMLRFFHREGEGALITAVVNESAAATAGLQPGETILSVDGETVADGAALIEVIAGYAPDDTVTLEVESADGETRTVEVTLGTREDDAEAAFLGVQVANPPHFMPMDPGEIDPEGQRPFKFEMVPGRGLGMMAGVLIREVADDSPAADAGLAAGDLITEVDGEAVTNFAELRQIIADASPGDELVLTIQSLGGIPPMFRTDEEAEAEVDEEAGEDADQEADEDAGEENAAETRTVTVTLGENEEGNAYLGIVAAPFSMRASPGAPQDSFPGQPCFCLPFGEGSGGEMRPDLFFFRGGPRGREGIEWRFRLHPDGEEGGIELTPAPTQTLTPSQEI